jgi:hypothetical protein
MSVSNRITASLCIALLVSACSTGSALDVKVDESPQGAVSLKRISDRSFLAAHPIKIDSSTIALLLHGILIRDEQGSLQRAKGGPELRRAFSGSEVGYLAPLISEGLRRAASDQQVGFRVERVGLSEPTTGVLYAYGRSLYVTLIRYRSPKEDGTGLENRAVSFIPEAAKRPDSFLDTRSTDKTLVIDYELLAMLPPASIPSTSVQSAPPGASSPATTGVKVEPAQRDAEIEALRKELEDIKKQLAEQEAERARSQKNNTAPEK